MNEQIVISSFMRLTREKGRATADGFRTVLGKHAAMAFFSIAKCLVIM